MPLTRGEKSPRHANPSSVHTSRLGGAPDDLWGILSTVFKCQLYKKLNGLSLTTVTLLCTYEKLWIDEIKTWPLAPLHSELQGGKIFFSSDFLSASSKAAVSQP